MKTIYDRLLILLLIPALAGCRYTFDIRDNGLEPCICLMSYICADSLSNISVYKTVPVQMTGKADMNLISPSYSLKSNGKEVDITSEDIDNFGIGLSCGTFKEGDRLEVTFSADGMDKVTASTTVPGRFPEYLVQSYVDANNTDCIRITYEDDGKTDDYYAVAMEIREKVMLREDKFIYRYSFADPPEDHNDLSIDLYAYSPIVCQFNGATLFIWADSDEEDGTYDLKYSRSTVSQSIERAVRFHLYKLSREMYYHLYADYDSSYNPFSYIGFSSPSFAYTNVMKGCGYFCAYSERQSDWIIVNKEEEE